MLGNRSYQTFDVQYLGTALLSQVSTGLGILQKPLRDLYFAYQRPAGIVCLNSNLLTVTDRGLVISQPRSGPDGHFSNGAETFYAMPSIQFWDAVQFVTVCDKGKRYKCAFEPINLGQHRPTDNLFTALDYKKDKHLTKVSHPVILTIVLRRATGLKALDLHAFVCSSGQQAVALCQCLSSAHGNYRDDEVPESGMGGYNPYGRDNFSQQLQSRGNFQSDERFENQYGNPATQMQNRYNVAPQSDVTPRGGLISEMWRMNNNGFGRNAANVADLSTGSSNSRGYELTQDDFLGNQRRHLDDAVYGNGKDYGMRDKRTDSRFQPANLNPLHSDIYMSKNELFNDSSRLRPPEGIYGNYGNVGSAHNLEWPGRQPQQNPGPLSNNRFIPSPFVQSEQGIYGQAPQEQVYNKGPNVAHLQHFEDNIYGKSNFQMIQAPIVPKPSEENIYAGKNLTGWSVGEAKKATDGPLYGNLENRNFEAFNKPNSGPFATSIHENSNHLGQKYDSGLMLSRRPEEIEPPQRQKGTSPSYRRKFPAWSSDEQQVSKIREQDIMFQNNKQRDNSPGKPFSVVQNIKEISINPPVLVQSTPAVPVPQNRPPPVSNEPIIPGVRKSVFGIFPRELEVKQNSTKQTSANSIAETNEKPIALVQPRKVQGIRVFPTGDDIYGKAPKDDVKRGDVSRPVIGGIDSSRPINSDDPDQPIKDREIASMFGKLNFDNTTSQPQNNFEKSLGYLP